MPRFVALLRGVSPLNCKMPELKRALESAGFTDVKTVLASGNAVFSAKSGTEFALEQKIEAVLKKELGREFPTIVRSVDFLRELIERDPFKRFKPKAGAKCVVTFFKTEPTALQRKVKLPIEQGGARLFGLEGRELFTAYVVSPKGPVFMVLIEKNFGKDLTTRTWDTLLKLAR